jgi:hypothetical protein
MKDKANELTTNKEQKGVAGKLNDLLKNQVANTEAIE